MLANYSALNYIGFRKLLDRVSRRSGGGGGSNHSHKHSHDNTSSGISVDSIIPLERYAFSDNKAMDVLITHTVQVFSDVFEGGDCQVGKVSLNQKLSQELYDKYDMTRLGAKLGFILCLLLVVVTRTITP